jgi:hypothetical protein
LDHH